MITSTCLRTTIICTAAALLSGCIAGGKEIGSIPAKPVLNPTPVAFETKAARRPHNASATEADSLSQPQHTTQSEASRRLALLQAAIRPSIPTKASTFAALADGPLNAAEIKTLFLGLEVITDSGSREIHRFGENGIVDGDEEGLYANNLAKTGTMTQDTAEWVATKNAQLCMDWFDWYSGDRICFRVAKQRDQIVLTSDSYSISYDILN